MERGYMCNESRKRPSQREAFPETDKSLQVDRNPALANGHHKCQARLMITAFPRGDGRAFLQHVNKELIPVLVWILG